MKKMHSTRRDFIAGFAAVAATGRAFATQNVGQEDGGLSPTALTSPCGLKVRFLGSGASGWKAEWAQSNPHMRRQSSVLLDGKALVDFTSCSFDKLPEGCRPEVLFQTHSHGDHYSPNAAVRSGVKRMYVHETWAAAARREVAAAAERLSLPPPEVIALPFASPVEECGMRFTAVPANHSTSRVTDGVLERPCLYLVEKGGTRLLYATDTGGLLGDAARMIGIDPHVKPKNFSSYSKSAPYVAEPKALTAIVMEATNGDIDDDFRLFVHSSVQTVARIVSMLGKHGRYLPPEGQCVYLTHLGLKYRDWPSEKIEAELPENFRAAYDGLEVVFG